MLRIAAVMAMACVLVGVGQVYDPLDASGTADIAFVERTIRDTGRQRDLPVRVYLPAGDRAGPVVLFSHGLGGARTNNAFLGLHWASRGYVSVFMQHPGSDEAVWQAERPLRRLAAMRRAANAENFMLRVGDVGAVLDALERWAANDEDEVGRRLDLTRVGMSGHSFGAVTTQAVGGQSAMGGRLSYADPRIDAAIAFSPSAPRMGDSAQAFSGVSIPWLLMTGTKDVAPIGDADLAARLAVFPALPAGSKYELVLDGAEHSAFSDRALPGDTEQRNPNHHRVMLALSTAFWDAHLQDDDRARAWLDGDGARGVLAPGDRWQKK
jgi:predicted dienelactone hydrolase